MFEKIEECRTKIDLIDTEILKKIEKRVLLVKEITEIKKNTNSYLIKPKREYSLLLKLITQSTLNKNFIISFWRKIISISLNYSNDFSIGVYKTKQENIGITREYYGSFINIKEMDSINTVMQKLQNNEIQVGVFEYPNMDNNLNWWINLINNKYDLKIYSTLEQNTTQLLTVAKINMNEIIFHKTLVSCELNKNDSVSGLESMMFKMKIKYKILQKNNFISASDVNFYLILIDGDFNIEEFNSLKLNDYFVKPYLCVLGGYYII